MRFHLLGLAHIPTHPDYQSCAYTQKVIKLAKMLKSLGHEVYFYGTEGSEVECDRMFTVGLKRERFDCYGDYDWNKEFFKHNPKDRCHYNFNSRALAEINSVKQPRDFLLVTMGNYQKPIADAVKIHLTVESGIGYSGVFTKFRVWESYAWMHHIYGMLKEENGVWYDAVIPNYYDQNDFCTSPTKGDYYLYIGRLISRKGVSTAVEATKRLGKKLIIAGQGDLSNVDGFDFSKESHIEYVGTVNSTQRAKLMSEAIATFVPTWYIGPFEGVHVESMMCGTPVLTTDFGVFPESVIHGVTGWRCRTLDEFVWAARNCNQLNAEAIRNYAVANYSMNRVASMYEHYFKNLQDLYGKGWYQERPDRSELNWLRKCYPE